MSAVKQLRLKEKEGRREGRRDAQGAEDNESLSTSMTHVVVFFSVLSSPLPSVGVRDWNSFDTSPRNGAVFPPELVQERSGDQM